MHWHNSIRHDGMEHKNASVCIVSYMLLRLICRPRRKPLTLQHRKLLACSLSQAQKRGQVARLELVQSARCLHRMSWIAIKCYH